MSDATTPKAPGAPKAAVPSKAAPAKPVPGKPVRPKPAPAKSAPPKPVPPKPAPPRGADGARPLAVTGLVAAAWSIGIGLAVLTTITLVGWIAAPRTALGPGLPGVFRTAVNFWLVAHHAGFWVESGRVGLLPLGLTVLPGVLLYRSGGWMIRAAEIQARRRIGVIHVALGLAGPYAALAALLALAVRSPVVRPSAWQALVVCFMLAFVAGGLGAARALVATRGKVRSGLGALLRLLPERPRSMVMGVVASTAVLLGSGAVLVGISLAVRFNDVKDLYDLLAPGVVGGILLLLVELVYLPNVVIWGMAYTIGPGFSVGAGTTVSPTGVLLGAVPAFPPLAALPEPGPAPALSLIALAMPFVAGAAGGVLTIRSMPSPVYEAAPLWGFLSGALTGCLTAVLAALAGGPLGGGRMITMGPSAWQVGLMAALEVGVSAAIAAWITNWALLRRPAPAEGAERADTTQIGTAQADTTQADPAMPETGTEPETARAETGAKARTEGRATGGSATGTGSGTTTRGGIWSRLRRRRRAAAEPAPPPVREPQAAARPAPAPSRLQFVDPEPVLAPRRQPRPVRFDEDGDDEGGLPDWVSETPPPSGQSDDQGATIHVLRPEQPDRDR
ncbi:cell division protein PerM [Actinomadura scrupuli]|uniref:cell division protein PerM n=1 Tax=Actinomadura scrupuli TaxID=559629 RepID=UPI003D9595E8